MKLKELETSLEKHRTICYKKDGNSITYHNKDMRQVEGNVYCGEPKAESQWNSYCMLYVLYPEQKVAMEIGAVNADYDTAEAANVATRNGIETQDTFINTIKRKIEAQEHIQLSWIEYLKYIHQLPLLLGSDELGVKIHLGHVGVELIRRVTADSGVCRDPEFCCLGLSGVNDGDPRTHFGCCVCLCHIFFDLLSETHDITSFLKQLFTNTNQKQPVKPSILDGGFRRRSGWAETAVSARPWPVPPPLESGAPAPSCVPASAGQRET